MFTSKGGFVESIMEIIKLHLYYYGKFCQEQSCKGSDFWQPLFKKIPPKPTQKAFYSGYQTKFYFKQS